MISKNTCLILILLFATACGRKSQEASPRDNLFLGSGVTEEEAIVESATSVIGGMSDDQAGENYAQLSREPSRFEKIAALLLPSATADACVRAYFQVCNNGVKQSSFANCDLPFSQAKLSGYINLAYSNLACSLANNGDFVTRTYDVDLVGPRGGTISISSDNATDYRGLSMGGGGRLSRTAGGWTIDVLGKHKIFSYQGRVFYNVSLRTLAPIVINGTLSRVARTVTSGQLEVNHNLAKYTAVFSPQNLQWNSSCCHPVSGTLGVTYSGAKTGVATVTFKGCGLADFSKDGQNKEIALSYCE